MKGNALVNQLLDFARNLLDAATRLLQGEPLRAIGYGAAVVVFLVANASGRFADLTFDEALNIALAAVTTLIGIIETARRFVYSPNTVARVETAAIQRGIDVGVQAATGTEFEAPVPAPAILPDVDLDA